MIRYTLPFTGNWEDCLKSVIEDKQMEACRQRLLQWEGRGLFDDPGRFETDALRRRSYYAREGAVFSSPDELRGRVLAGAAEEAAYLGREEDDLIKKMAINGWSMVADDWDQLPAIESLLKRLWCTIRFDDDNTAEVIVAPQLREILTEGLKSEKVPVVRDALFRLSAMLHSIRYIYGFVFPCPLLDQFRAELEKKGIGFSKTLTERFVNAEMDYMYTRDVQLFLPHPGLADPERILSSEEALPASGGTEISFESMLGGMGGILPEEVPSVTCLKGLLMGAIRPENDLNQTVDDLRFMAKQGAGLKDLTRILKGDCSVLPTQRMIDALERMRLESVLWTGCLSAVKN